MIKMITGTMGLLFFLNNSMLQITARGGEKATSPDSITGEYLTIDHNIAQIVKLRLLKNGNYTMHDLLRVNADSTFEFIHCGSTSTGTWRLEGDSLKLFCERNTYNNDSMAMARGDLNCRTEPLALFLDGKGMATLRVKSRVRPAGAPPEDAKWRLLVTEMKKKK